MKYNHRKYFKIKSYRQSLLLIHILESFKKFFTMAIALKNSLKKGMINNKTLKVCCCVKSLAEREDSWVLDPDISLNLPGPWVPSPVKRIS